MNIQSITLSHLTIPLRVTFKHAQTERSVTDSLWVNVTTESRPAGHGESCPRGYVTGESVTSARAFFRQHAASIKRGIHDLPSLTAWVESHQTSIDSSPAAWCALELALLEALAISARQPVADLLAVEQPGTPLRYSAVIGDDSHASIAAIVARYRDLGMSDFKIKLSGNLQRDLENVEVIRALCGGGVRVRADANNCFRDTLSATRGLRPLRDYLWAVEEPVQSRDFNAMRELSESLGIHVILDESACTGADLAPLAHDPHRWVINLRVSKMGGLLRTLDVARRAQSMGLKQIVGAHVGETSLLTRAGTLVGTTVQSGVIAREGAFGTYLLSEDVCASPLMFGNNGQLDIAIGENTMGWQLGLHPNPDYLHFLESA